MDPQQWSKIRGIFNGLVALEVTEQADRLATLGASDPELHRALEALLAADAAAEARLRRVESLFGLIPPAPAASSEAAADRGELAKEVPDPFGLAGRTLSHFRVLEPLGAGGMGVVYRAEDTRLGRAVALKFLLPQLSLDPAAKARFLREARAAAALDHPNLCTIHEVGESEDGRLFLAMTLYPGETLQARLARQTALPVAEALGIARQIAHGLACAHAAGIVHRDLKPGNVLLLLNGTVKLLDFGLAKVRELSLSGSGARLGTVAYMAPEQLREEEAVDARTDLWALGVVLYQMLTSRRPFGTEHELATVHAILHTEPIRPAKLRADLPAAVEEIVLTLLRKDPERRYPSAEALLQELTALPQREEQSPPAQRDSGRRWKRAVSHRHVGPRQVGRVLLGVAAITALLALGLGARALWWQGSAGAGAMPDPQLAITTPSDARSIAVLPFANLSESTENEYFSDGITDEILTTLANVGSLRVISRTSVMQYKESTKPARQIAAELAVSNLLTGSVQREGDRVRIRVQLVDARSDAPLWAERYDRPLQDIFAVQSEIAQEIAQALRVSLSAAERARMERRPTTSLAAHEYVLRARNLLQIPGPQMYEPALELIGEAIALDSAYADAFAARAFALHTSYWFRGDAVWLDSAVSAARQAIRLDPSFAPGHAELGGALGNLGDRQAALEAHRRAVELNPNLADGLAVLYEYDFGRLDEAAHLWQRVLATDPTNAITLWMAGRTYLHLGMPERARALFARARQVQPGFHWMGYYLSLAYLADDRREDARAEIQRTLTTTREDPDALLWAGHVMAWIGDLRAARTYFERGLPVATSIWEKEQAGLTLAGILQQSGETRAARHVLRDASSRFETRRRGHPHRPEDHVAVARIRVVLGDREGAIQAMQEAVQQGWRVYREQPNDPILGSLRGDPRFDRLMAEVEADVDRMRTRVEREGW
jgi:eukaryotic-like serine/threonine-protein kinase